MAILSQIDLQIQHDFYRNPNWLLCRNWQADPKIHMEIQGTQKTQSNFEKEQQRWRTYTCQFQNLIQSYNHWDSVVGTSIRIDIDQWNQSDSPEINLYIYMITDFGKCQDNSMEKECSFWKLVLSGYPHAKEWSWLFLLHTIHKRHHQKVKPERRPESPFWSNCNDPKNYGGKRKPVKTKIPISAFTTCETPLSPLHLFSFHSTSYLLRNLLCTKPWGNKMASKTDTDRPELSNEPQS